jgi:H+-transporting ATPase
MCSSVVSFMLLDVVKVFVTRYWSFELTARLWPVPSRTEKLRLRMERNAQLARVTKSIAKVRRVAYALGALGKWKKIGALKRTAITAPPPAY